MLRCSIRSIEAAALARYRFFAKLGFFGLDTTSPASVRSFLRTARAILARPRATLWITAQGRFADVRERPVGLRAGTGHVLRDMDRGAVIPLALEMGFWEERTPEAFALFGPAIDVDGHRGDDPAAWTVRIATALEAAQDRLADDVQRRDPAAFETLIGGAAGVGGIYDLWRRARARIPCSEPLWPRAQTLAGMAESRTVDVELGPGLKTVQHPPIILWECRERHGRKHGTSL